MNWGRGLSMLVLGLLSACAEVVIEREDEDGGGGSGGAELFPDITSACEESCENYTAQCDYGGSCVDQCLEAATHLAPCAAAYESLTRCSATLEWLDEPECTKRRNSCAAEADALFACVYPTGGCELPCESAAGVDGTSCSVGCGGVSYVSLCSASPDTGKWPMDCTCQIDGETVGSCQNVSGNGTYYWSGGGCCSTYFAEGP